MAGATSADKPVRNDIETMVGVTDLEYICLRTVWKIPLYQNCKRYSPLEHGDVAVKILSFTPSSEEEQQQLGRGRGDSL